MHRIPPDVAIQTSLRNAHDQHSVINLDPHENGWAHLFLRFFRFLHNPLLSARHQEPRLIEHGWDSLLAGTY
jgi:alpha-ketoglutarate-dependent taurine dioxygenase